MNFTMGEVIMQKLRFNLVAVVDGVQVTRSQLPSELTIDLIGTSVQSNCWSIAHGHFLLSVRYIPKTSSYLLACVLASLSQQHGCWKYILSTTLHWIKGKKMKTQLSPMFLPFALSRHFQFQFLSSQYFTNLIFSNKTIYFQKSHFWHHVYMSQSQCAV